MPTPYVSALALISLLILTGCNAATPSCPSEDVIKFAKDGDMESFRQCLEAGNDPWIVEAPEDEKPAGWELPGSSALFWAARHGHTEIVELLVVEYGVSPNWGGSLHWVPLVEAIDRQDFESTQTLLAAGADTRRWDTGGATAVLKAIENQSDPRFLEAVLEAGAFVDEINGHRPEAGPYHLTLNWNLPKHAYLLAEHGACVVDYFYEKTQTRAEQDPEWEKVLFQVDRNYNPDCKIQNASDVYKWKHEKSGEEIETAEYRKWSRR